MRVKFTKDTTCCLGGNNIHSFEKDAVVDVSDKLGKLLVAGKQASKTKADVTVRETATDKPEEKS